MEKFNCKIKKKTQPPWETAQTKGASSSNAHLWPNFSHDQLVISFHHLLEEKHEIHITSHVSFMKHFILQY